MESISKDYIIMTDSSCDLPSALADELELTVLPLTVMVDGRERRNMLDESEITYDEIYKRLRAGEVCTTSAVNVASFESKMEELLKAGHDILYIGFSSGLSATYNSGETAARALREKYPERKLYTVDSLSASLGQGLLIYHAVMRKRDGMSIDEVRDWVEENKLHLCHMFTVDDLMFLKRGGRISGATAAIGTLLNIKPVMHMDDAGHLVALYKTTGRKKSLKALVDRMEKLAIDPGSQTVFITHGDCIIDANYTADLVSQRFGVKNIVINHVGPVIGSHSGPGTIALFFLAKER